MMYKVPQAIVFLLFLAYGTPCYSLPLSTINRWIVDNYTGQRVKLACVNWPSHMLPLLAEGLDKQPLTYIAAQVANQGYNCVRLTWATYMFTRPQYSDLTVEQSFDRLNLTALRDGMAKNNPSLLPMNILRAFDAVVAVLGSYRLMVILDNHISQPIWCCGNKDGNGFFNDPEFNPDEWMRGLTTVAQRFKGKSQVVAIGLRNELRGPHQNVNDWYQYISQAAKQVHQTNPDVLVIASGLNYALDLRFLGSKPIRFNLDNKLVFESHLYAWSGGVPAGAWVDQPVNQVCAERTRLLDEYVGFLITGANPFPLIFSEFGINEQNVCPIEDRLLSCFQSYAVATDLDWGLWGLQGGYYFRDNKTGLEEVFGLLDISWSRVRNPTVQYRLELLRTKLQEPTSKYSGSYVMYHPRSGTCVRTVKDQSLIASDCKKWSAFSRNGDRAPIVRMGTNYCLKAVGDGVAPILSTDCQSQQSTWEILSNSRLHLGAKDANGEYLCLHMDPSNKIVTRKCICIGNDPNCKDDPTSQWFQLAPRNV